MSDTETLYVWKKDNANYAVSKLPFGGYEKYDKKDDGCWVPAAKSGGFKPKRSKTKSKKLRNN